MSKADELFDWWRKLPSGLRPYPFAYSKRNDVELAQFQRTLSDKLDGLQLTLERPFSRERQALERELRRVFTAVAKWLDVARDRFNSARFEMDYMTREGTIRLTWRPALSHILEWLDGLKAMMLEAAKRPLQRPFLSLVGADQECLEVPDFQPICGLWSDNYFIGQYPWRARQWNAVIGPNPLALPGPTPLQIAASGAQTVWLDLLEEVQADVRKGHQAVKDSPWTVVHALCELSKPDGGPKAPDMAQASLDRVSWATALHVPFRRWLHDVGARHNVTSPLEYTDCYPTWLGFSAITGDDATGMIGGRCGHQRACFFAFLLDELSTLWASRKAQAPLDKPYKKIWHGEAIAYKMRHPEASLTDTAHAIRKSPSTLSRDPLMRRLFAGGRDKPKGFKTRDRDVVGIDDPDSLED